MKLRCRHPTLSAAIDGDCLDTHTLVDRERLGKSSRARGWFRTISGVANRGTIFKRLHVDREIVFESLARALDYRHRNHPSLIDARYWHVTRASSPIQIR